MDALKVEIKETVGSQTPVTPEPQKQEVVAPPVKQTEEPKYVRLEDLEKINQAINNTREYSNRKINEVLKALEDLKPKTPETKPDDLDEIVQKNWQLGVEKVVERVLTNQQQRTQAVSEEQRVAQLLEESKTKVMARHPELSDPENPKTREFLKVLEENPDFRANPRGPLLAAYEMEERMKANVTIKSEEQKPAPQAKEARSRAASIPAGTSPGARSGYTLSKSDLDFCRLNGINPENYKRYKGASEARA